MDREDEIVAAQRALSHEEQFELELAMLAGDGARRDNRDEEHGLLDRLRNLRFPHLAGSDGFLVLPQAEIPLGAPKLRAEVALDGVA